MPHALPFPLKPALAHEAQGPDAPFFALAACAVQPKPCLWISERWQAESLNPHGIAPFPESHAASFALLVYPDAESLWQRAGISPRLGEAIQAPRPLPLFAGNLEGKGITEPEVLLNAMKLGEEDISGRLAELGHPDFDIVGETTAVADDAPRPAQAPPEGTGQGVVSESGFSLRWQHV